MTISVVYLGDAGHERLVKIIHLVTVGTLDHHTEHSRLLHCSDDIDQRMIEQCSGAFMQYISSIVGLLADPRVLAECEFVCGTGDIIRLFNHNNPNEHRIEDHFADTYGQLVMHLATERLFRDLWRLRGWPWSMGRVLQAGSDPKPVLEQFKADLDAFTKLEADPTRPKKTDAIFQRSMFQKTSVTQLVKAVQDPGFMTDNWLENFKKMLHSHNRVACPTQLIECIIGAQKGIKTFRRANRIRRPERMMGVVLRKEVLKQKGTNNRHWDTPSGDIPVETKMTRLTKDAWRPEIKKRSLPWNEVVSTSQTAAWYSPSHENFSQNVCDLQMLQDAAKQGLLHQLGDAWIGKVATVEHRLLINVDVDGARGVGQWYQALHHFNSSSILCWPGQLRDVVTRSASFRIFTHDNECKEPVLISLLNIDKVMACSFTWRSWCWAVEHLGSLRGPGTGRLFPVVEHGPCKLLNIMAEKAFWNMPRSDVVAFAALRGILVNAGDSLLEVLVTVLMRILGCTEEVALEKISQRLAVDDVPHSFAEEILAVDEALAVMDSGDIDTIHQEQKGQAKSIEEGKVFAKQYKQKRADARAKAAAAEDAAKGKGKGGKGKGKGGKGGKGNGPDRPKLPSMIEHADAKQYIPPGASIWRGLSRGEWWGHMPPRRRVSAKWADSTQFGAMLSVIRELWRQWMDINGGTERDIPFTGLFEESGGDVAAIPIADAPAA